MALAPGTEYRPFWTRSWFVALLWACGAAVVETVADQLKIVELPDVLKPYVPVAAAALRSWAFHLRTRTASVDTKTTPAA